MPATEKLERLWIKLNFPCCVPHFDHNEAKLSLFSKVVVYFL